MRRAALIATAIAGSTSLGVAALGAAAPAYAVPNSHNNTCQFVEFGVAQYAGTPGNTPGNAATSQSGSHRAVRHRLRQHTENRHWHAETARTGCATNTQ
jgi:hypothetical protein